MERELGSTRVTVWAGRHKGAEGDKIAENDGECMIRLDDGTIIAVEVAALSRTGDELPRETGT